MTVLLARLSLSLLLLFVLLVVLLVVCLSRSGQLLVAERMMKKTKKGKKGKTLRDGKENDLHQSFLREDWRG